MMANSDWFGMRAARDVKHVAGALGSVAAAGALSSAFVVWRTWPLAMALDASDQVPQFDWLYATWTLAWQIHAMTLGMSPAAANIYHPATDALYYGPLCTGLMPIFAPVYLWSGNPLLAIKLSYLIALTLTGMSVHLVVRAWTRSWTAGAVAVATLFACDRPIAVPMWAPQWAALAFFAPLVWAIGRARTWRGVALVALLAAAQSVTEPVYVAPAVLAVVTSAALARVFDRRTRPSAVRLLIGAVGSVVLILPIMSGYLRVRGANPHLDTQSVFAIPAEYAIYFTKPHIPPLPHDVPALFLALALVVVALTRRLMRSGLTSARSAAWLDAGLLAVVPFAIAIALPCVAIVLGREGLGVLRAPDRLFLGGFVGVALVAGLAWSDLVLAACESRRPLVQAILPLAALVLLFWCLVRLPRAQLWVRPEPRTLRVATPLLRVGTGPVLHLPVEPLSSDHVWPMYQSLLHWRPLLNGYASYWPAGWKERMADAAKLPDADALARLVRSTGLSTIVVTMSDLPPAARERWRQSVDPPVPGLVPVLNTNEVLIFDVVAADALAAVTAH